jgi:hypothetical protein
MVSKVTAGRVRPAAVIWSIFSTGFVTAGNREGSTACPVEQNRERSARQKDAVQRRKTMPIGGLAVEAIVGVCGMGWSAPSGFVDTYVHYKRLREK